MSWTRCKYCRKLVEISKRERHEEVICPHCCSSFKARGKVPDEEVKRELGEYAHTPVTPRQVLLFLLATVMLFGALYLGAKQLMRDKRSMRGVVSKLASFGLEPRKLEAEPVAIDNRHLPMRRFTIDTDVRALCDLLVFEDMRSRAVVLQHTWPLAHAPAGFGAEGVTFGDGGDAAENHDNPMTPLEERQHEAALKAIHWLTGYAFNYRHLKQNGALEPDSSGHMERYTLPLEDWQAELICRRSSPRHARRFGPYSMQLTLRHTSLGEE